MVMNIDTDALGEKVYCPLLTEDRFYKLLDKYLVLATYYY
jgi:hypothetical protein